MTRNLFFKSCEYCVQNILLSVERTTGLKQTDLYHILWNNSENLRLCMLNPKEWYGIDYTTKAEGFVCSCCVTH